VIYLFQTYFFFSFHATSIVSTLRNIGEEKWS